MSFNITTVRFYRNTHVAPDYKQPRPDLDWFQAEDQAERGWVYQLVEHDSSLGFYGLLGMAQAYNRQHQEPIISPTDLWLDIKRCLRDTTLRIEL